MSDNQRAPWQYSANGRLERNSARIVGLQHYIADIVEFLV
jgi:hypothetical protein